MAKVITDIISWSLPCTEEVRYFTEQKQANQWMKMHRKRCKQCKDCKDSEATFSKYDINYTVRSASDLLQLQQINRHLIQQIDNITSS